MQSKWLVFFVLLVIVACIHGSGDAEDNEDWDLEDLDADVAGFAARGSDIATAQARHLLVVLTDQNAHKILADHEYVILLGYASWCTRSSALMPEFAKAASSFAGSVLFAKLDALSNPKTASLYNIKGFPTVLFFTNGSYEMYPGGDTKEEIVNWVRKKTGTPTSTVILPDDARNLVRNTSVFVGGFFSKFEGDEYECFIEAAKREISTQFIQTTEVQVAQAFSSELKKPPAIWMQKDEPQYFVLFDGPFGPDEILNFVELNKLPLVVKMNPKNSLKLSFSPVKLQVLLFADLKQVDENIISSFQEVASIYKGKMLFLLVDYADEDIAMPLLSVYGLGPGEPIVAAFDYERGHKYVLESAMNTQVNNLKSFLDGLLSGKTPLHYRSAPVQQKAGPLQIVVGKNFESVVLDESKDVFLQVTTPWCTICEAANKTVEKLAHILKDVPSLVIAQFDASENEHPLLQVDEYPTFLFYPAGKKTSPLTAPTKSKLKSLIEFIKKNAAVAFPEEKSPPRSKDEL